MRRSVKRAVLGPLLVALMLAVAAGCGRSGGDKAPAPAPTPGPAAPSTPPEPVDTRPRSPISGLPYDAENAGPLVAVMVENHSDARPQSGLIAADLVYEALTEGGISRFMALYYGNLPKVIGPVRSARPYYVLLAHEWDAIYAHAGGDPKDREPIKQWGVADADEIYNAGGAFWRSNERKMPHNLYTSVADLRAHAAQAYPRRKFAPPAARWEFVPWAEKPVPELDIRYGPDYHVTYKFEDGAYRRYMNDKLHTDKETDRPVQAANVLIQFAATRVAYPDGGLEMKLTGKGEALLLTGGRITRGSWQKDDLASATRFLDAAGKPAALTAGQTWIQLVPTGTRVTYPVQATP
ncbi:MAG: DUF3048 domain-containing protein [Bacillota bacterium]